MTVNLLPEVCDLHIHVGASVAPHIMWSIAHEQGLKLPVKNYWEFVDLITSNSDKVQSLQDYLAILHKWNERIQSSPSAIERSVYEILGKEFRSSHVTQMELRFNPMKRNIHGERDLDHIIHAAIRGLDRACLEYGMKAGLIFCLAREWDHEINEIILNKAIKYSGRGVIGIDVAGPESSTIELSNELKYYKKMFEKAKAAGLGTTIHTGETEDTCSIGMKAVLTHLKPDRIGHGVRAARCKETMQMLVDSETVLEICPTSNLHTRAVSSLEEMRSILGQFWENDVQFTINTDGTYFCRTNLQREFALLKDADVLSSEQLETVRLRAFEASFLP